MYNVRYGSSKRKVRVLDEWRNKTHVIITTIERIHVEKVGNGTPMESDRGKTIW